MTTLREAAQQALEALESLEVRCTDSETVTAWYPEATDKLREALAEPAPEPVAWTTMPDANDWIFVSGSANPNGKLSGKWYPLYTHPPQRKPLTDEEMRALWESHGYKSAAGEMACEWTWDALKVIRDAIRARGKE